MLKFHPYSILTRETMVGFVIYCVLSTFGVNFTDISGGCEIMMVGVLNPPSSTMSRKLKVGVFTFPASSILSRKLKVGVFILVPSGICSSWVDSSSLSKVSFLGSSWTLSWLNSSDIASCGAVSGITGLGNPVFFSVSFASIGSWTKFSDC